MENLPTDIIEDIFSLLPIEPTLLRCKRVCTTWRELLRKYKTGVLFAYKSEGKIQFYYGDQDEVTVESYYSKKALTKHVEYSSDDDNYMVGSCNGLVCLYSGIFNPVIGEFLRFSDRKTPVFSGQPQGIGFGYLPSTNEYKVVRTGPTGISSRRRQGQGHVHVYTLGSQSGWRRKKNIPYEFDTPGIFANGAIHWMCITYGKGVDRQYKISAFDLADESFKDVPSPCLHDSYGYADQLMLLGGNLCFIHYGHYVIDIWAFKRNTIRLWPPTVEGGKYYDDNWSWTKDFRLPEMLSTPIAFFTESNEVLAQGHRQQQYCYNAKTSTITKFWDGGEKGTSCLQAVPHINTLVSLKELGECSGKYGDESVKDSRG